VQRKPKSSGSDFVARRDAKGRYLPGESGCPPERQVFVQGNPWAWKKGQSGNQGGLSRLRAEFEAAFHAALLGEGQPDEAARMLWKAARAGESWAVLALLQRIAPQDTKVKLEVHKDDAIIDYRKLSDEQLRQLESILEAVQPLTIEGGEGASQPA
jgi:hypothetical protein